MLNVEVNEIIRVVDSQVHRGPNHKDATVVGTHTIDLDHPTCRYDAAEDESMVLTHDFDTNEQVSVRVVPYGTSSALLIRELPGIGIAIRVGDTEIVVRADTFKRPRLADSAGGAA